jgi:succinoglycan biosynthesis transport protein ExoP
MMAELGHEQQRGLLSQFQHYWHILLKWKWISLFFFLTAFLGAVLVSFLVRPVYTASGSVWIENNPNILPFEDVQSFSPDSSLQSNARLLQSRTLAADTIEKLKLYANPAFAKLPAGTDMTRMPEDPIIRERMLQRFLKNVVVSVSDRTRLVDVQYSSPDPRLSADILNALFDGYIRLIIRKKYAASEQAAEFLNTQVKDLRTDIEAKERELNRYGSEKDILPPTAAEAPLLSRITDVSRALNDATIDRLNKYNRYNQLKAAPLGEIPNAPEGSLIERLRTEYVTLNRQYVTRLATVKPEFPAMQRLKSELDAAKAALQTETDNIIQSAYNDYQAALRNEQSLQTLLNQRKAEAYKTNSNSVVYNSLKIELDNKKSLLEAILKRQNETDVSSRMEGLDALNVWIVDKADYPLKPSSPDKAKNALFGLLIGLAGGIGLAFGLEYLNNTVKTSKDVTDSVSLPTLGFIPAFVLETRPKGPKGEVARVLSLFRGESRNNEPRAPRPSANEAAPPATAAEAKPKAPESVPVPPQIELIAAHDPQSIQAESYRSIRTTLLVSSPPGKIKTMLFTSPLAKEGKSATVSNLGITFAEAGKRVVIVDSDLRKPKQAKLFGILGVSGPGLSQYLSSELDAEEIIRQTAYPNLSIITSGAPPANPIELLSSEKMDSLMAYLKRNYDFVLLDAPPILAVSDTMALGPMADTIILVVRGSQTPIPALKQARAKLDAHRLKSLGVILNGVDLIEEDGYYSRQYYNYSKAD